ncbi:MAG: RNA polymerase sigma factor [Candidatus Latescibacteria bacterium]|nr:RNA polymerase sigma factor [Candidatus Latescibacterota bacterium]
MHTETDINDPAVFSELFKRHSARVHSIAYRMTGNAEDAKDITQDVFIRLYQNLYRIVSDIQAGAWLNRMTVNRSIDILRGKKNRWSILIDEQTESVELSHSCPGPDITLERKETHYIIGNLLDLLSPNQRKVFVLRDLENFSTIEISEILKCSQATVRVHLSKARDKVKTALLKRYPGITDSYKVKGGNVK